MTDVERFWSHVVKAEGCWLWALLPEQGTGYGQFRMKYKKYRAHRLAWEFTNGPISKGMHVLHHCDVRMCVRPDHLWLGTNADNVADMLKKGRTTWGEFHRSSKLSAKQVLEIRAACGTQTQLIKRYGVGSAEISRIRTGKRWANLIGLTHDNKENLNA